MTEPEETEEEKGLRIQAAECPLIRGAFTTGDPEVIARMEKDHPPSRCHHVKAEKEREEVK